MYSAARLASTGRAAVFFAGETPSVKACGFASSLWEGAFGIAEKFAAQVQSLRERTLPRGELSRSD